MHHRAGVDARVVEGGVKRHLLRRGITADKIARRVEAAQTRGVEPPEAGAGRADEEAPSSVRAEMLPVLPCVRPRSNIDDAIRHICSRRRFSALLMPGRSRTFAAWAKKPASPKLPDLSVSERPRPLGASTGHARRDLRADRAFPRPSALSHRARRLAAATGDDALGPCATRLRATSPKKPRSGTRFLPGRVFPARGEVVRAHRVLTRGTHRRILRDDEPVRGVARVWRPSAMAIGSRRKAGALAS
jgi:hypothetical protein